MIFVTVGTQLPFDRLVLTVDAWAAAHPTVECFAQIGAAATPPKHVPFVPFVPAEEFDALVRRASLIVAHAGMGSVLTALRFEKPILIMPRHAAAKEHRDDHQLATARWLQERLGVRIAWTSEELQAQLDARESIPAAPGITPRATGPLIDRLRSFLFAAPAGGARRT